MKPEKQTGQEVVLPAGEENEESLPLFPKPPAEPAQEDSSDIDWETDPSVILKDQAAVAAYFNRYGELVVRQRDTLGESASVYIRPDNVRVFLDGLRDRVKRGGE